MYEYSIYGKEAAPTTGTPHLQGYLHFKKKCYWSAVKKLFPLNGRIIPADGNATQNRTYCSKDGDFVEFGTCPLDGNQTIKADWDLIRTAAQEGRLEDINAEQYIKYYSTLKRIHTDTKIKTLPPDLDWIRGKNCPNEWIYGDHNTGIS